MNPSQSLSNPSEQRGPFSFLCVGTHSPGSGVGVGVAVGVGVGLGEEKVMAHQVHYSSDLIQDLKHRSNSSCQQEPCLHAYIRSYQ